MKESYNKGVANYIGPESCLDVPQGHGEALTAELDDAEDELD